MKINRSPILVLVASALAMTTLVGCSGEEKQDPAAAASQLKQRGAPRPGGAPPGFPVAGEASSTSAGAAPGTASAPR